MERKDSNLAFIVDAKGCCEGVLTLEQAIATKDNGSTKTGEIASREFPTTSPDATLEQCLPLVAESDTPVAVLDEQQHLVGVITRPALLKAVQSNNGNNSEH